MSLRKYLNDREGTLPYPLTKIESRVSSTIEYAFCFSVSIIPSCVIIGIPL